MKLRLFVTFIFSVLFFSSKAMPKLFLLENRGQVTDQYCVPRKNIDVIVKGGDVNVFLSSTAVHYQFYKTSERQLETYRVEAELLGANKDPEICYGQKLDYSEQYYTNACPSGVKVHAYSSVTYKNVYPNIDRVIYIKDGRLEYDLILREGADPRQIRIAYKGTNSISKNASGGLLITCPLGEIAESAPVCRQENGIPVKGAFTLQDGTLSFELASYSGKLVIDPVVEWSTYYGGSASEMPPKTTTDDLGNVYLAGNTYSSNNIATTGSYQQTISSSSLEMYIAKFDSTGARLWATYVGGLSNDEFTDIGFHLGDIYITGFTQSATGIATPGSFQPVMYGTNDAFLIKFDSAGSRIWGTYLGGSGIDEANAIAFDDMSGVFIAGTTSSTDSVATTGAHQPQIGNNTNSTTDAFLLRFDTAGNKVWGTYYGGNLEPDQGKDIALDPQGNIYLAGKTSSIDSIATPGCHQYIIGNTNGSPDAFLVKFTNSGVRLWGTYYGGSALDETRSIACSSSGDIFLAGITRSDDAIGSLGAHQETRAGIMPDMFLVKFNGSGVRQWGTYYGDSTFDECYAITTHSTSVYLVGSIGFWGFVVPDSVIFGCALQPVFTASPNFPNAVIAAFSDQGAVQWSTYYGAAGSAFSDVDVDPGGDIYLSGQTTSTTGMTTTGSHQPIYGGGPYDAFLSKFSVCATPATPTFLLGPTTVCDSSTNLFVVVSPDSCNISSYTWTLPTGWTGNSSSDSLWATSYGTGTVVLSVAAVNACNSVGPAQSLNVTVVANPVPTITQNGNTLSTGNYSSYQWLLNSNPIAGATNQTHNANQGGIYTIEVTDQNGCTGVSAPITLGVSNLAGESTPSIFPNPARNVLFVNDMSSPASYKICDVVGKEVRSGQFWRKENQVTLEHLPPGFYILKFANFNFKFIKE